MSLCRRRRLPVVGRSFPSVFTLVSPSGEQNLRIFMLVSPSGEQNLCIFMLVSLSAEHFCLQMATLLAFSLGFPPCPVASVPLPRAPLAGGREVLGAHFYVKTRCSYSLGAHLYVKTRCSYSLGAHLDMKKRCSYSLGVL